MFEPIVPILGHPMNPRLAEDIRRMHADFGIRRFVLIGPGYGAVSMHGIPSEEEFRRFAGEILALKQQFADDGIEIGWWCVFTMDNGAEHPEFQHVVNHDGTVSPNALCPLDAGWRKVFTSRMRIVAELAHPSLILVEDDLELSNQVGVNFGCFCPLHLEALSRKLGRSVGREELAKLYADDMPEGRDIKRQFTQVVRDSILLLAQEMREAVDAVDPAIRLGMCEPMVSDRDGYLSLDEPRILAGRALRPLIRVEGAVYSCRNASSTIPETLAHAMYTFERMPESYEVIHETDTYPHTRYFMSAQYFGGLLTGAVACGAQGTLLYGTQYLDDALEDDGYFRAYAQTAPKIQALAETLKHTELDGLRVVYSPEIQQRTLPGEQRQKILPSLAALVGRFGIPYSTKNGNTAFLIGKMPDVLTDEEILRMLSGGMLLDAQAAEALYCRGFGKYLGVDVTPMGTYRFCQEKLCDIPELRHIRGRSMYNYATYPAGTETDYAPYLEITPCGAEEVSCFADCNGERTNAACTRFENSLDGRVVVFAAGFVGNATSNLFCYRKKELFRCMAEWANRKPLPAVVLQRANVWLLVRRSAAETLFFLTDLNGDDDRELRIRFAPEFAGREFRELLQDGSWKKVAIQWQTDGTAVLPGVFRRLEMRVFACAGTEVPGEGNES